MFPSCSEREKATVRTQDLQGDDQLDQPYLSISLFLKLSFLSRLQNDCADSAYCSGSLLPFLHPKKIFAIELADCRLLGQDVALFDLS